MDGAAAGELAGMVDAAMLLYYLGLVPVLKNAQYQAQSQEASVAQLADVERRLNSTAAAAADYARHLREAQHVFRDDIVDNTRFSAWNKALFSETFQLRTLHEDLHSTSGAGRPQLLRTCSRCGCLGAGSRRPCSRWWCTWFACCWL